MSPPLIRAATREDAAWIIETHGALYRRDEGFDARFEPLVARVVNGFMTSHDPKRERAWVVTRGTKRAGSLFCCIHREEIAKLRLFLLLPELRGQGLGRALLGQAIGFARQAGYSAVQVSTYDRHRAAGQLYARSGFELKEEKPAEAFGQLMREQRWVLGL